MTIRVDIFRQRVLSWFIHLPGIAHYTAGKRKFGVFTLTCFLAFPVIAILRWQYVLDSIQSFFLSIIVFVIRGGSFLHHFRSDLIEWWFATIVLIAAPFLIFIFSRKSFEELIEPVDAHIDSQWRIAWRSFRKQRTGMISLYGIIIFYSIACLCPYIMPVHPSAQQDIPVTQYKTPLGSVQKIFLKHDRIPQVEEHVHDTDSIVDKLAMYLRETNYRLTDTHVSNVMYVDAYRIEGSEIVLTQRQKEVRVPISELRGKSPDDWVSTQVYLLGTDRFGRSIFSRLVYGSRSSLLLGFVAVLLAIVVGTGVGLFSGYFGAKVDSALMRFVDMLLAFPTLFLILIIISLFEKIPIPRIFLIVVVLGLTSWMGVSRLVRGQVLVVKQKEFILAAKALGIGAQRIIFRHILPNVLTPIIINATLRLGGIILIEAALSFLNLGVQAPTPSWGNIIYEGKDHLTTAWWISTFPGFAIVLTVISFNLLGDALRDALDPRLRE